ncbi:MAG TPA: patatin-like phospholipase family protein [Beijerinckiaceae bacterium]|nr:patatin-like phospholipase family protein [Beijerinckiaceae bacterium]
MNPTELLEEALLAVLNFRRDPQPPAEEQEQPVSRPQPPVIALALGAGAARGWAHIGILRVLEREGLRPKIITGTSIGAVVGGCWSAGGLDQLEIFARRLTKRGVFSLLDLNLSRTGLMGGRRLRDMLEDGLKDRTIENLPTRFAAVTTEFGSGHEVWLTRGHLVTAMRASYAIPGVFEPVRVGGKWLLDGAMVNPIPITTARALGADLVIAVNVNTETFGRGTVIADHHASPPPVPESAAAEGGFLKPMRNAAHAVTGYFNPRSNSESPPSIAAVMVETINITQDRIARSRLAGDPPDVMIAPKMAKIGLFEFHRADEAIAIGSEAAERMLPEIREAYAALRGA